jgi:hypothetical protein
LITVVGTSLAQKNTNMKESILVEARVAMVLARLGNGNSLEMCGEVYGIVESTTSIIVKEICAAIRKDLKPLVIPKLIENKIKEITIGFERVHGIPYILFLLHFGCGGAGGFSLCSQHVPFKFPMNSHQVPNMVKRFQSDDFFVFF